MRCTDWRCLIVAISLCLFVPSLGSAQSSPAPSDTLNGKVRVVPNPWSASVNSQHYAGRSGNPTTDTQSGYLRVNFVEIPATCTIRIYTVDGDLVKTLEHVPGVSGDSSLHSWNMISDSDQSVVSGIYIWVVETPDGQREAGKLIIIR